MKKDRSGSGMRPGDCVDRQSKEQETRSRDKAKREQFARAIAKSEFGRYY